jgi:hypothetical protein
MQWKRERDSRRGASFADGGRHARGERLVSWEQVAGRIEEERIIAWQQVERLGVWGWEHAPHIGAESQSENSWI